MTQKNENKIICPNCEQAFNSQYQYCPHCGQKNTEPDLRFKHIFSDFLSGMFNLDSKFYQTFKTLLLKPGKLSKEYLAGKRTKYLTPVRIYLIVSFAYFTLLSLLPSDLLKTESNSTPEQDSVNTVFPVGISTLSDSDEVDTLKSRVGSKKAITLQNADKPDAVLYAGTKDTLDSNKKKKITKEPGLFMTEQGKKMFSNLFRKYMSIGMFFLIPLTAFIFYLMFYKGTYYIQHLVFVLHLQSVMFIIFIIFEFVELIIDNTVVSLVNLAFVLFFLLVWMKSFYEKSWWRTVWKSSLFLISFSFILILFMLVVAGVTFWNL